MSVLFLVRVFLSLCHPFSHARKKQKHGTHFQNTLVHCHKIQLRRGGLRGFGLPYNRVDDHFLEGHKAFV